MVTIKSSPETSALDRPLEVGAWLTVEYLLWVGIVILGAAARFWDLGGRPLNPSEAANALASWQMIHGLGGSAVAGPLLVYGNALVFLVFGANDASARLLPAFAGVLLVATPFLFRRFLGRTGALASAFLLAFSPSLLFLSRSVNGEILTALMAVLLVAVASRVDDGKTQGQLIAGGVVLALLVLSGFDFYTILLVLAGVVCHRLATGGNIGVDADLLRRPASVFVAVSILGASGMLLNLHGIQETFSDGLMRWLGVLTTAQQSWHFQLQILVVYETLALVFGVIAAFRLRHDSKLGRFLLWWLAVAFVVSSASRSRPGLSFALSVVPLILLAGKEIGGVLDRVRGIPRVHSFVYLGATLSLLVLFWIATLFFTLPGQILPASLSLGAIDLSTRLLGDVALVVQLGLLVATILGLALWLSPRHYAMLWAMLALIALASVGVHSAVLLSYAKHASPAELLVSSRTTQDVRSLVRDLTDSAYALSMVNRPPIVRISVPAPDLFRWYLRDEKVVFADREVSGEAIVVAPLGADPPPGRFAANRYRVLESWHSGPTGLPAFYRWLTLREPPSPLSFGDFVLYVRMNQGM